MSDKQDSREEALTKARRDADAAIAKLQAEYDIREKVPGTPKQVMMFKPAPWVTYACETMLDALDIVRAFPTPLDCSARESGCLSVAPDAIQDARYGARSERWCLSECIELTEEGGEGYGARFSIVFYVQHADLGLLRIRIEPKQVPQRWHARNTIKRDQHGRKIGYALHESPILGSNTCERVKWSAGDGYGSSWHVSYYVSGVDQLHQLMKDEG